MRRSTKLWCWNVFPALVLLFSCNQATAILVASDDFESNSLSEGLGWDAPWSNANTFVNDGGKIDGTRALAMYGAASNSRFVSPSITTAGTDVTVSWSFRADWNVESFGEIGVTVNNAAGSPLLTYKFASGLPNNLLLNDGGSDFAIDSVSFAENAIYDFTFSSTVGSDEYSFTAERRGSTESATGTDFNFSSRTTDSLGGLTFFVNAPEGSGNDGFLDSVSINAIPEASSFLFGGLVCGVLGLTQVRRLRLRRV